VNGIRVTIAVVIDMTGDQVQGYADEYGLPREGGRLYAREVVEDVREYVLSALQQCPAFCEGRATVSLKGRAL
jgi:hypothetical protein